MANPEFFFFYAPTWDYPPGGPIKLGNVITSVKNPHRPLFCSPPPEDSDVFKTEKKSVQYTKEKLRRGKFSILTKFLGILGFGLDIGAELASNDEETFVFDTLETTQFAPTPSYVQSCVEAKNVRRFLELSKYRKPVYIITGLKVVTGAQANTIKSRTVGGSLPIGGGPEVEAKVDNKVSTKWEGSSDFVFAFRVSKVLVGEATGEVLSEEEYRKGALLDGEDGEEKAPELSVLTVEEPNARAEGFDVEELMDDEEVVFCAIPREDFDDW
ncbi:unnamed protein product [Clonostachys rosea]|uniref:Uncharacterized protein n=1 Tax=Bionectria ochroleuca TaxID=29856 RepID=A0ABY6UW10_BIOOC|nr:unnamed protein product [Clonostachys rosea]